MPPRYAYWTILIDNAPTAFRAKDQEDLQPTLQQLRRTNQNVTLKWFAHGRIWDSPELARARPPRDDEGTKRDRDWRPGGQHKDPRARFDKSKKKDRPDWKAKHRDARAPWHDRPAPEGETRRPRSDRPREEGRPIGRPRGDAPRADRPAFDRPRYDKPRADRPPRHDHPRSGSQGFDRPRDQRSGDYRPRDDRPRGDRPPSNRPQGSSFAKPYAPKRPWQDRPRPPHSAGGGGERDRRGQGGGSDHRPHSGGSGTRASGGSSQQPWRPREDKRPDRPWQGRPKPSAGDRDRPPSFDRRPPTDRRPTEKRPYAPRSDRPRDDRQGQRSEWSGHRKPQTGRAPVRPPARPSARPHEGGDERPRTPKGPKVPDGSDSE